VPKTVWVVPHTHFDAEVFLTQTETFDRAFPHILSALALLRANPNYRFVLDQKCYIEPFLKAFPEEESALLEAVRDGRLEIVCGMNAMPDVNIPSGESFIRQVLSGISFCEERLGADVRTGWLIDTFGQHPQIPQLMAKCGFDHNVFQRVMPKDSPSEFYWQGLDGTRLLCHWMPLGYAVFYGLPGDLRAFREVAERRAGLLASHAHSDQILALAGADLTSPEPHLPAMIEQFNTAQHKITLRLATPREFFDALGRPADLPTVEGDLNPVFQGCYSARIRIKQWNRLLENMLLTCEKTSAFAGLLGAASQAESIRQAWEGVTFNQFHDIVCGSQVDKVYDHVVERYQHCRTLAADALEQSLGAIAAAADTRGEGGPVMVLNPLGWPHSGPVEVTVGFSGKETFDLEVRNASGQVVPSDLLHVERYSSGAVRRATVLFIAQDVPSLGYEVYHVLPADGPAPETGLASSQPYPDMRDQYDAGWMENEYYRLELDLWSGAVTRLYDKVNGWEVLAPDKPFGGAVVRERDFGNFWQYNGPCKGDAFSPLLGLYPLPDLLAKDADFSHTYGGDGQIRQGKAHIEFNIAFPFGTGQFATRIRLYAGVPRIDFHTTLVNNDERVRYRVVFPTSLVEGKTVYEIPFGAIERPPGEFPAQNWIDYADGRRGIMLLNRGLPGTNVVDGVMMLSLLKCTALKEGYGESGGFRLGTPTEKGYEIGVRHSFDYALAPHAGDWRQAGCVRRGIEFNNPLIPVKTQPHEGPLPSRHEFLRVNAPNVIVSAVKTCPEGILLRVYESEGKRTPQVNLTTPWDAAEAWETNLIEKRLAGSACRLTGRTLSFDIEPFEIKTFKLASRSA